MYDTAYHYSCPASDNCLRLPSLSLFLNSNFVMFLQFRNRCLDWRAVMIIITVVRGFYRVDRSVRPSVRWLILNWTLFVCRVFCNRADLIICFSLHFTLSLNKRTIAPRLKRAYRSLDSTVFGQKFYESFRKFGGGFGPYWIPRWINKRGTNTTPCLLIRTYQQAREQRCWR